MAFAMSEEERKRQALANYALQQGNFNLRVKDIPKAPGVTVTDQPQRYSVKVGPSMQVEPIKVSTPYSVRNFLAGQNDKYSSMPSYNKGIIGFLEKKYDAVNANSPQDIFKRSLQGQQASYEGPNFGGRLRDMSVGALRETAKIPENIYRSIDEASSTIEAQKINDAINEKDPAKKRIKISKISDPRGPLVKLGKTKTLDSNMSDDELIKIRNELLQKRTAAPKYTEGAKRFLYGSEPVQSYQQRARGLREELATGTSVAQQALGTEGTAGRVTKFLKEKADIIAPALAGLTVIGDVTPVGKSKNAAKLPKEDLKILSKSVDPNEVKAVVSKNNIELSDNAVKDIVEAKNTKTVNKIIGEDLKAASDNIAKEADNLVGQKIDNQNITNVAKTTEPTRNEAVSDAVVTELVKTKTPQEVTDAVDALFPTLPKEEKLNLTNKIAQTQDVNQIKQLVEEAKARETQLKETVQVNTPEQVATTQAEQTQQAMEEAVPAPKPAPESTQAPISRETTTTAPDGVQGATTADNVPDTVDMSKIENYQTDIVHSENLRNLTPEQAITLPQKLQQAWLYTRVREIYSPSIKDGFDKGDAKAALDLHAFYVANGELDRAAKVKNSMNSVDTFDENGVQKTGKALEDANRYNSYRDSLIQKMEDLENGSGAPIEVPGAVQAAPQTIDATKYNNPVKYLNARIRQIKDKSQQLKDSLKIAKLEITEEGRNSPEYVKLTDDYKAKYGDTNAPEIQQILDEFDAAHPPTNAVEAPTPQSLWGEIKEKASDVWQKIKEQGYDPWIGWQKIDDLITKRSGSKLKDADAASSLVEAINRRVTVSAIADRRLLSKTRTGQSVADVFNKYPDVETPGGIKESQFVKYLHARFFLEVYEKSGGKIWKGQGFTPQDAARGVADFEAQNPTARLDADTIKAWADDWVDFKVANKEISAEHGNNLKNAYSVYAPLERAINPDLISPTLSGGRGGVGMEKIAQNITEEAGNYDNSLGSIKNRNLRYEQESADNDILLLLDKASRENLVGKADDVYIAVDPEKVQQREVVVSRLEETRAQIEELKKQRNKATRQTKKAKAKLKQAEAGAKNVVRNERQKEYAKIVDKLRATIDKAQVKLKVQKAKLGQPKYKKQQAEADVVSTAKNELLKTVTDPDAKAVISKMTKEDLIEVFQAMADDAPIQAGVWGRLKKLNVTRKQYNKLVDDITGQRQAILVAKQQLTDFIGNNKNLGAIGKMTDEEVIDALDVIASKNVESAKNAAERLKAKGGFYKELTEQLQATRDEIRIKEAEAAGDWAEASRLNQTKPKYENLVPYYKDGYKGYMHISKDMASEINSMRKASEPSMLEKGLRGFSTAAKWLYTGAGAPVFRLVTNPIISQGQAYVIGEGLSSFGARPIGQGLKTVFTGKNSDAYMQKLIPYGFRPELSTRTPTARNSGVEQIASMVSKTERAKYLSKHWGELYNVLNSGLAKLDNAARIQVARGAELRARRRHPDWTEDQIMAYAAKQGNNVLGNFNRVSRTARDMEAAVLYSGATQSGYRQMMRTFRERPLETGAKIMSLVGAVAGGTAFMLGGGDEDYNETMKEYYDQKIASGNTTELDSNLIIGIPGKVNYDEKTNTWAGIVKVPIPPDYRPLIRASWKTAYEAVANKKFDPAMIGRELANFGTADQASNIRNPKTGMLLPSSPVGTFARIALGQDPRTGKQLETEYEKTQPRTERYNKYTSDLAKNLSKVTNGAFTPKMIDAILSQSGYFGSKLKSIEDGEAIGTLQSVFNDFSSKIYGSKGFSEKQQEGKEFATKMDELYKRYGFNENEYNLAKTLFPIKKDKDGKDIKPKGYYVSSNRAGILANSLMSGDTDLWEFAKEVSKINREPGDPVDPLYELDNDKAQQILALMAQPSPQNLDSKVIRKQNPWIKDFYTKRAEFFDKIIEKQKTNYEKDVDAGLMTQDELAEIQGNAGKDFMGVTIPKMSPEVKALQAKYDELKKGDDATARFEFMKDNPELQQYYDDKNDYDRFKRTVMRLPLLDEYPKASPKVQAIQDEYNALPKNDGPISKYTGKATSPSRSAWFKANPAKAALLTEQWYKQNLFDLQGAAALATYEGEALDEDAFNDIKKIAEYRDKLASGTNGYGGYSKFGYNFAPKEAVFKVSNLLGGIQPGDIKQSSIVKTTPNKVKFKAQKPSGKSRTTKRLRLQ